MPIATVLIPLKELTKEQLAGVIQRMQQQIDDLHAKTDAEVRSQNERLKQETYKQGYALDSIAETLTYVGFKEKMDNEGIVRQVRQMAQRMRNAEAVLASQQEALAEEHARAEESNQDKAVADTGRGIEDDGEGHAITGAET